jgi:hypothetical protein
MKSYFRILSLLYLFLTLILILSFNNLSVYFFPINIIIAITLFLSGKWVDIRIGFLLFLSLYYIGHFFEFFIFGMPDISSNLRDEIVSNLTDHTINLQALTFVVASQLGVLINFSLNKTDYRRLYFFKLKKYPPMSFDYLNTAKYLMPFITFLFLFLILFLDWARISEEYTLSGVSTIFFTFYALSALLAISFIYNTIYLSKTPYLLTFYGLFAIFLFNYLGVRQTLLWGGLIIFISSAMFIHCYKNNSFSILDNGRTYMLGILFALIFLILIGISFSFRHQKIEMMNVLMSIDIEVLLDLLVDGFFAETRFTSYNLLAVVNENNHGHHLSFVGVLLDMFTMLIPHGMWPSKYEYIESIRFSKEYDVTPFGTWYIVGLFTSIFAYPSLVFLAVYTYSGFLRRISIGIFNKSRSIIMSSVFYGIFYVFLALYVVRGTLSGGFKLAITLILMFIVLNLVKKILLKCSLKS